MAKAPKSVISIHKDNETEVSIVIAETQEQADTEATAQGQKALKAGHAVTWKDGRKQWINVEPVVYLNNPDNMRYDWDASGDRIRCNRILVTMLNGERGEKILGTCFKLWENAWS